MNTSINLPIPRSSAERVAAAQKAADRPKHESALLLTVARILRAKIANEIYAERDDDLWALNEALGPFDPSPDEPVNEHAA
jgi:predicted exporter